MEFQCEYLYYSCLWFFNAYTCKVTKISKTSSASQAESFVGTHLHGRSNSDVKYMKIVDQSIDAFPRGLQLVFPNLKYLTIQSCGLQNISKEDLEGLENLEYLNLWFNKLTSLPDDLFVETKKLVWIDFYKNQLERLSSRLLQPIIGTLEFVDFTGNVKVNDFFNIKDKDKNDLERLMKAIDSNCLQRKDQKEFVELAAGHLSTQLQKFPDFQAPSEPTHSKSILGKPSDTSEVISTTQHDAQKLFMDDDAKVLQTFKNIKNFRENKIESFHDYFNYDGTATKDRAMELFKVASNIRATCTDKILANLNDSNALEVFNLGHHHQSDELKQPAFNAIQKMFPEIPDTLINNPDHINKLVLIKREFDAVLAATKSFPLLP